jgi:DNA-binding MarR family transcriptional regulator
MVVMSTKKARTAMLCAPEGISAVESQVAYWVKYVGYCLTHQLRRNVREFGVTAAESVVLRKLYEHENGAMPSLLAMRLGLTRGYLSRLAKRLEIKGLVNRDKSVSDRRALILSLTGYARVMVRYLAGAADETNARNFAPFDDEPLKAMEAILKWIVRRHRYRFVPPGRCGITCSALADLDQFNALLTLGLL